MRVFTRVYFTIDILLRHGLTQIIGIGPKVTQSVLTAALLFAFKDALYEQTVRLRMSSARKSLAA
jgi:hypothetical protein